jgi:hypothetical protein
LTRGHPAVAGGPQGTPRATGRPAKRGRWPVTHGQKAQPAAPGLVTATPNSCWRSRKASRRAPSPAPPCTCPRLPAVGRRPVAATSDRRTAVVHQPPRQASPERGHTNDFSATLRWCAALLKLHCKSLDQKRRLRAPPDLGCVDPGRQLCQPQAVAGDVDDCQIGDDPIHHALTGEREGVFDKDLR